MKVAALVLAAGGATRFGRPKQLLQIDGENLVQRACRVAREAGCSPVVLVLGAHADVIRSDGLPDEVDVLVNDSWQDGMGTSIATGVRALSPDDSDALIIMLADQPGIGVASLQSLIAKAGEPNVSIVLSHSGEAMGPPALFTKRHFATLAVLEGDQGGRGIAKDHPEEVATASIPESRWDIDVPDAWREFGETALKRPT